MKVRGVRPSDLDRRKRYDVGPRLPPDEARKALRVAVLGALADWPEPITAVEVWRLIGAPEGRGAMLAEVLDDMVEARLVETTACRRTPAGPLTTHFSLTAKE